MTDTPFHPNTASSDVDDFALLKSIQSGDADAMAVLFDRYSRMTYSVAFRILNDANEAEAVTREVFLQLWHNPVTVVSGQGSLGSWLIIITRNRAIDKLRQQPSATVEPFAHPSTIDLTKEPTRTILLEKIQKSLTSLPAEQRKLVELAFFDGMTHSEIAARTGEPPDTIKTQIRLTLMTIRKGLQP